MKITVWNAFSANNSGSYTIIGLLPSEEVAESVAAKLRDVIERHDAWMRTHHFWPPDDAGPSPLETFCRDEGLSWAKGRGEGDEWPSYTDGGPEVAALGRQVAVRSDTTISMPTTFGEAFYRAGGRVEVEIDHAHHPVAVTATCWFGHTKERTATAPARRAALVAALVDDVFDLGSLRAWPPAWQVGTHGELVVGVVFRDILAGAKALREVAKQLDADVRLDLRETPADSDPFAHLRPCEPAVPRFDVVLDAAGADTKEALATALQVYASQLPSMFQLPVVVARAVNRRRADAVVAAVLASGGAARTTSATL